MQGNCTQPPAEDLLPEATDDTPGVFQMLPMRQNQCLVLLDTALLQAEGRLWLDGLYVRLQRPHSFSAFIITVWPGIGVPLNRRGLWMTDVTVQSDSGPHFGQESGLTWGVQVGEIDFLARGACRAVCAVRAVNAVLPGSDAPPYTCLVVCKRNCTASSSHILGLDSCGRPRPQAVGVALHHQVCPLKAHQASPSGNCASVIRPDPVHINPTPLNQPSASPSSCEESVTGRGCSDSRNPDF